MGILGLFKKKEKSDVEKYYEEREKRETSVKYSNEQPSAYEQGSSFRLFVQDVFTITGRGTVITGMVECGCISVGDNVTLRRSDGTARTVTVTGIEMFRKMMNTASQGDNVGLLLRNVQRNEINKGDVLEK